MNEIIINNENWIIYDDGNCSNDFNYTYNVFTKVSNVFSFDQPTIKILESYYNLNNKVAA